MISLAFLEIAYNVILMSLWVGNPHDRPPLLKESSYAGGVFDSAKNHKRERHKRQTRKVANAKVRVG